MHKRTIRLAISAIMLALFVSVPVDAAGQERDGVRQRQPQQRERSPRAGSNPRRAVPRPRASAPRDSDRRGSAPRARSDRRGPSRRGFGQRGFGQRGFGQLGFGQLGFGPRGFRYTQPRFNFNFQLGPSRYGYTPQYYPPYSWERMPYNGGCGWWDEPDYTVVYRGGRWVRQYVCVNMSSRNGY